MPWHPSLNQLRDALVHLYPSEADARVLVDAVGLRSPRIFFYPAAILTWQSILEEADRKGQVQALIQAAATEHPADVGLLAAMVGYYQGLAMARPSEAAPPAGDPLVLDLGGGVALQLARVPAEPFLMGTAPSDLAPMAPPGPDETAEPPVEPDAEEKPQHQVFLPEFLIGKYPVTVAQYHTFVGAVGYPLSFPGQGPGDHPVVLVSWPEALAFCDWASHVSGRQVRLPSEAEWEKAARGTDGRLYPWGNQWDPTRCNSQEGPSLGPTSVTRFSPGGDSPYGCADMVGNVWEWTCSLWGKEMAQPDYRYPYNPSDGRENLDAGSDILRVVRGGSFNQRDVARCTARAGYRPGRQLDYIGFRIAVSPAT